MTKTLIQIFFFSLHQNQNIFFTNIGNHNFFLEKTNILTLVLSEKKILNKTKNHNPPLQVKWSFPYPLEIKKLTHLLTYWHCLLNSINKWNYVPYLILKEFFFQNLTLGYMTKTLNQIIFFSSTKIRIFFSPTLGIIIFF
jgi:hypothetical protein